MRYRLTFIVGAVVGYVLGARAGRERYEQLRAQAQKLAQNPAVRNTAEAAVLQGRKSAVKAAETVSAKVGDHLPGPLAEKVRALRNGSAPEDDWGTSNT
ncbi:YtxH domain-containing protein [Streptomyces sp. HPF1205]|uniref:YtxH domain-containing protein n=1 Tax=Streptomyces sp. HPF1205 TaxID=2873262 RepID=UPI001CEC5FB5|nr:YtxH domain-containing protein [Streptomyces sp. HPF1205]